MAALFRSDFKRWIDGGGDLDAALKGLRQGGRELGVQIQFNAPPAPVVTAQKDTAPQRAPAATEARARAKKLWQRGAVRAAWKPRRRGSVAKNIYIEGGYTMLIRCVNGRVRAAMSKTVLLAFLACSEEADYDGQFEMPAGQLGDRIGCNRRNAQRALYVMLNAGLIRVVHGGGPRMPNVYGLTPAREFEEAKAIAALETARQETTADIRLRKASGSGPA
ncbi:MAG: hypothetical protein AUH77_08505 [Candidatus Rokubacteria bacterium 13_1_40CM_4_69_39]|nr:MAG: hypothetical protein AUH77_08505 [Candidatus Rokubacteria bacterium 13_1_40CM_4_69_39]